MKVEQNSRSQKLRSLRPLQRPPSAALPTTARHTSYTPSHHLVTQFSAPHARPARLNRRVHASSHPSRLRTISKQFPCLEEGYIGLQDALAWRAGAGARCARGEAAGGIGRWFNSPRAPVRPMQQALQLQQPPISSRCREEARKRSRCSAGGARKARLLSSSSSSMHSRSAASARCCPGACPQPLLTRSATESPRLQVPSSYTGGQEDPAGQSPQRGAGAQRRRCQSHGDQEQGQKAGSR